MKEFVISEAQVETAILVGLVTQTQDERKTMEYLDELEFLAETAGATVVKRYTQKLPSANSVTYVGKGKLEEIKEYIHREEEEEREIGMVIFDDELSAKQIRNIEAELKVKILDRTSLILDIFAMRAQTANAKTQVELAQYKYMLPRLQRLWTHLERQGGGSGAGGGKGAAGGRGAAAFAGVFCFPAGKAGGQTPLEAPGARKQGKIRKNSGNCVKNCSSHFLFGLDCGILFNGILSKPIATAGRHAKAPDLCRTHKRNAALSGDGHRVFPVRALRPAENTEQEGYTLVRGRV